MKKYGKCFKLQSGGSDDVIEEIRYEHDTQIMESLGGHRHSIQGTITVSVSMVFYGDEVVEALSHAQLNNMGEYEALLLLADAVARRDGIGSHSRPEPTPEPTQRQPTGKRVINLD